MIRTEVTKPDFCWLFGGMGFHHSEATMTRLMTKKTLNERVYKTFREISPTFGRVFAGYADWSREAMDAFADYYDQTFRKAGTTLYLVPGRMPMATEDFDIHAYAEQVAERLDYLVNERRCRKIRYYCATNELSRGNTYCWFGQHLDEFRAVQQALYAAFRRHGLDIGLMATDVSGIDQFDQLNWAADHMDEITEVYCAHNYEVGGFTGDPGFYQRMLNAYSGPVATALKKEKRFVLGEYGIRHPDGFTSSVMRNDVCNGFNDNHTAALTAISLVDETIAAINAGCLATVYWTLMDYPDPFLREDGDTPEDKVRYDCARFSGHGLNIRYNKWGLMRWEDEARAGAYRPFLYTLGLMARYFRKGTRVLKVETDDADLHACAVCGDTGHISLCLVNICDREIRTELACALPQTKKARMAFFRADEPYENAFGDLQPWETAPELNGGTLTLPPRSMALLTTDYEERTTASVKKVTVKENRISWMPVENPDMCYYRVFADGKQIASTVATELDLQQPVAGNVTVCAVDRWGNSSRN